MLAEEDIHKSTTSTRSTPRQEAGLADFNCVAGKQEAPLVDGKLVSVYPHVEQHFSAIY